MAPSDELAARRSRLTPAGREALERRLRGLDGGAAPSAIPRRPGPGPAPLSFAQQRLWFLQQLAPESSTYNEARAVRITGPLDVAALAGALREVTLRHEVLRATYHGSGSEVYQTIHATVNGSPELIDLRDLTPAEREIRAMERVREEAHRPFDLGTGPMVRTTLLRTGDEEYVMVHVMHHIVADGWSIGLSIGEIASLYRASMAGLSSPLAPLAVQYADFAHWQRERLQGETLERELSYWKSQLAGIPAVLDLPADRPRPAGASGRGGVRHLSLPGGLLERLRDLSQRGNATLFMTLLAVFQIQLHRYSGQEDIVVGTPVAGRTLPELEQLIGFFVNTLVLRTRVTGGLSYLELLERVRETALQAYAHQELPFERLVEELRPVRSLSFNPLFQAMFVLENFPAPAEELPALRISPVDLESGTAKFDLMLVMRENPEGLAGWFEYNADLFDAATIDRMGEHLGNLLEATVADPTGHVADLAMLSPAERRRIVVEWNAALGESPAPGSGFIHRAFETQVERTPGATALECAGVAVSYAELNRRANRLARRLLAMGVGPDRRVAILLDRSISQVVALLAVMKTGGAFVPVLPTTPGERLSFLLEDADPAVIVTRSGAVAEGLLPPGVSVAMLDGDEATSASELEGDLPSRGAPGDPAYVMYTSGSTGRPKGVVIGHEALAWQCAVAADYYGLSGQDRVLQFASPVFDTSLEQLLAPLTVGASVVLRPVEPPDAQRFPSQVAALGITVCNPATAFWRAVAREWAAAQVPTECPSLRLVVVSAEAMLSDDLRVWDQAPTHAIRLLNAYGPTEATIHATIFEIPRGSARQCRGTNVPIGRPLAGRCAIVLDCYGNPVPAGVAGELHLGGAGLAIGYWRREELTRQKFIVNKLSGELPGERLYKTGDLARYLPDGTIEYIGRTDNQVKIRGFRVELGEIEAVLKLHPGVREAAAVLRGEAPAECRIAAFFTCREQNPATEAGLRAFLARQLPDYMIPSALVRVDAMPMTSGGKLDRGALREPEGGQQPNPTLTPRTPLEEVLTALFADALGRDAVGVEDDFFVLGGHSLLATQAISRAREALAMDLPLRWIFEYPTVARLAARIEAEAESGRARLPAVEPVSRRQPIPLGIAQEEFWAADHIRPGTPFFNISKVVRIAGQVDEVRLAGGFGQLIRRHEALRTTFSVVDGTPVQIIGEPWAFSLEVFDLGKLALPEHPAALAYLLASFRHHRFDLARGPLLRVGLASFSPTEHVVLLTMHHIVSDGWSLEIMAKELELLYAGMPGELPGLALQYADFAVWQRNVLAAGLLDGQLTYWKRRLSGCLTPLRLPADRERPAVRTFRYGREQIEFPERLTAAIETASRRAGATVFMMALAAFKALLWSLTGQTDIRVGTIAANRQGAGLEGVVGLFINPLVLRSELSGELSFGELLGRVRHTTLEAFDRQDVPFERVLESIAPGDREALSPVLFLFESGRLPLEGIPGTAAGGQVPGPVSFEVQFSTFEWIVEMRKEGPAMNVVLKYDADMYEEGSIRDLLWRYQSTLEAAAADPARRISQLTGEGR